jgi:RNA polymerase sigma-70 factor (ECF subfamily)
VVDREELDALVARAQKGDRPAFEALAAQFSPQVRRFARAFAGSDADADDLAQEALLRVYRNLRRFTYQSAFSTWLYAVVRNVFLDAARGRAGTARRTEEPLADDHADREGGARPDHELEREQERRRVWDALQRIPAEYRTALVLFDIEGCTYDEVAAVEGVPVGTIKSRLHRGRAHLRTLLEAPAEGPGTSGEVAPSVLKRRP